MSNPEAPKDDTMQEQTVQNEPTEQLDTADPTRAIQVDEPPAEPAGDAPVTDQSASDQSASDQQVWPPAVPDRPTGPHAPAIVLGLVCLAVAVIVLAQEVGSLSVDWGDVGPLGIVAVGALLVVFGLVGLLSSRRNTRDQ